ncbi:crossover junction endodeoxyribonuclease RuvC [Patescibacteria group bacterium]|nr:crossover junction endodeoxyribonuclease RuvC [Patescibacteria group bacterium]
MIILGIDPGTANMGYGVLKIAKDKSIALRDSGVIKTYPGVSMPKRLTVLYANLNDVVKTYKPDIVVIERLFFNVNVRTAMTVGEARGVSMLMAAHNDIDVVEYTALQAKKILTGFGRAKKKEMQEAVKNILGLSQIIKSDDANDGVAMALCHFKLTYEI